MSPFRTSTSPTEALRPAPRLGALAASAVLHGALLVAAALLLSPASRAPAELPLSFDVRADDVPALTSPLIKAPSFEAPQSTSAAASYELPIGSAPGAAPRFSPPNIWNAAAERPQPLALLRKLPGWGGRLDAGEGSGAGRAGGWRVFDQHAPTDSVVYVVDCSQSMNYPHPGPARTRFARVKLELLDAVSRLASSQKFFIVYFSDRAFPMPTDQLTSASDANKRRYLEWMAAFKARGNTDPRAALLGALSLQPDVVYFLTDGDFRKGVIGEVTQANQGRSIIHTIGFGDDVGEPMLREIARRNRGTYKFISNDGSTAQGEEEDSITAAATRTSS